MPSGIYLRTKQNRENLTKGKMGHPTSEKTKIKISNSEKGKIVSMETRKRIGKAYIKTEKRLKQITELGKSHKGENAYQWKGGISRGYKTGYWSTEYKKWRMDVFTRDNFTCAGCGMIGGYLTAHHIHSFAHFPKLRFVIDNGITLCENCHKLTDNYKGRNKR